MLVQCRLAGTGRHLRGVAAERLVVVLFFLALARFVERDVEALEVIAPRFVEEDDGLGGFELRKEQAVDPSVLAPVLQQFQRCPRRARITFGTPLLQTRTNQVDERELDRDARRNTFVADFLTGRAIEVLGRPALGPLLWIAPFLDVPVPLGLVIRRADDWLRNFEVVHERT